jgi:hypothetical protein
LAAFGGKADISQRLATYRDFMSTRPSRSAGPAFHHARWCAILATPCGLMPCGGSIRPACVGSASSRTRRRPTGRRCGAWLCWMSAPLPAIVSELGRLTGARQGGSDAPRTSADADSFRTRFPSVRLGSTLCPGARSDSDSHAPGERLRGSWPRQVREPPPGRRAAIARSTIDVSLGFGLWTAHSSREGQRVHVELFARRDLQQYRERMRRRYERIIRLIHEDNQSGRIPPPISLPRLEFLERPLSAWIEPLRYPPRRTLHSNKPQRHHRVNVVHHEMRAS